MIERTHSTLALFDFDGTLTRKDTFIEFIKFFLGKPKLYSGLLKMSPILILFKLKIIPNGKAKEKLFSYFFKNFPYQTFQEKCNQFAAEIIPPLLKKEAIEKLNHLKNSGVDVVVVSASAENWVNPWCKALNIPCIATKLEVIDGKLSGKLSGKNCYGAEKVKRIQEKIDLSKYQEIYAFGDSKGDIPMLKLATRPYYKCFNEKP